MEFGTNKSFAWVELTRDLQKALQVNVIIYKAKADNDDMNNFIASFSNIMSMCQLDPEDPSHLICTLPSPETYTTLAPAFITTKMMLTAEPTEEGNQVMTATDNDGKSYDKLTLIPKANTSNGAQLQYLLGEDLQTNFQEKSGMKMAIAKISFFIAGAES